LSEAGYSIMLLEPLAKHTSFGVGGPADIYAECATLSELKAVLAQCKKDKVPFFIIGGGTNLLVKDGGYRGACIKLAGAFTEMEVIGEIFSCGAGVSLVKALSFAADSGLSGLEKLAGIPGTVGGAVFGNAGTRQGEIKDAVSSISLLTEASEEKELPVSAIEFGYRRSSLEGKGIITGAKFKLVPGVAEEIRAVAAGIIAERNKTQPKGRSAGSVFKNPESKSAGRLIEECGLKGLKVGSAEISMLHANYIINGGMNASDVLELIKKVKSVVLEKTGIALQEEIKIVGEDR